MIKRLIKRSEFATACGVTPAAVTKACLGFLKPAVVGDKIDADHPKAQEYHKLKLNGQRTKPKIEDHEKFQLRVDGMNAAGKYTAYFLTKNFGVEHNNAKRIIARARELRLIPPDPKAASAPSKAVPPPPPTATTVPAPPPPPAEPEDVALPSEDIIQIPDDIKAFLDWPLGELLKQFGSAYTFVEWLNATQKIEAINEKRLKNAKTEGELVSRELVKTGILDRIDGVFVRMLSDGAKTIASRAHSIAVSGGEVEDVRRLVEDQLGSFIEPAKVKMSQALRDA